MPERRFETAYWSDPFVMKLPAEAKLLYVYLWTNLHCNQAGLYEIAPETISFETGLAQEEVPKLLCSLEPKITWCPEQNLVWVKNFLRHQTKSPQFLVAAAKCLQSINNNGLVREFLEYNRAYNLSIPYQYPIDREAVSDSDTLPLSYTDTETLVEEEIGVVKGKEKLTTRGTTPASESEYGESLSSGDRDVISVWRSVKGFRMAPSAAAELVAKLRTDFPDVDILTESKKWAARKLSEPMTKRSRPSGQLYNFMEQRHKWNQENKGGTGGADKSGPRAIPKRYTRPEEL